jgi:hypothetical protein
LGDGLDMKGSVQDVGLAGVAPVRAMHRSDRTLAVDVRVSAYGMARSRSKDCPGEDVRSDG